jgi:invasion protein IalB
VGRVLIRSLAAMLAMFVLSPVFAQETETAPPEQVNFAGSGWQVQCDNSGTALACMVIQRISSTQGAVVAAVAVRLVGEPAATNITIQLPLGILVSAPVTVQVDSGVVKGFAIRTCVAAGCVVEAEVPALLLEEMKGGTTLRLGFQSIEEQPVSLDIPLTGFALALERL